MPTIAILGASTDRSKFGNKAVRAFLQMGYEVYPVNPKATEIEGLKSFHSLSDVPVEQLDRVSVYLPPAVGMNLLDEIKSVGAKEIWFNPGSENTELLDRASELGIEVIQACSLVDIGVSPHSISDE
jgi:hypothetical protein